MAGSSPPVARVLKSVDKPLLVYFDESSSKTLRCILTEKSSLFLESSPSSANVIVFGSDEISYIKRSPLYNAWRSKAICISEEDIPTFILPGLYVANMKSFITSSRAKTINYFISERDAPNLEIRRFADRKMDKRYLYSFMGASSSWARKRLFRSVLSKSDTLIEATNSYNHWTTDQTEAQNRASQNLRYAQVMASSKFVLCPRGCGLSSYRLFESMSLGVAPVIISDQWRPIEGIDWNFAIFLPEHQIPNIDHIMRAHESEWEERGQAASSVYKKIFDHDLIADWLHDQIIEVVSAYSPRREAIMAPVAQLRIVKQNIYWRLYGWLKYLLLRMFYIGGFSFPVTMAKSLEQQLNKGGDRPTSRPTKPKILRRD